MRIKVKVKVRKCSSRGFSLLELIIVLLLIGLLASLITPSLSRFSKSVELKATTKKVAAILRSCRSEAVNRGNVYQVLFDLGLMQVTVQSLNADGNIEEQHAFPLPSGIQIKEVQAEQTQFPSDLPAIEFYPNGGSNGGHILLDGESQNGYRISINFLTGAVVIGRT